MSNFICEKCGKEIIDSPDGYVTGCEHYPVSDLVRLENELNKATLKYVYGHNTVEQNKANYEMMRISEEIRKLREGLNNETNKRNQKVD